MNAPFDYYVLDDEQRQLGPYTETELRNRAATGSMPYDTLVWREGFAEWVRFADCFPLPSYETLLKVPAVPRANVPSPTTKPSPSYPKWPWILFTISCLFFFSASAWMTEIENQAAPYIAEYNRMSSTRYTASVGLEAFIRGALGDPFGKADEEAGKSSYIRETLVHLHEDYQVASTCLLFFFCLALAFAVTWIVKHRTYKKMARG